MFAVVLTSLLFASCFCMWETCVQYTVNISLHVEGAPPGDGKII
jgi:hypothetical protein